MDRGGSLVESSPTARRDRRRYPARNPVFAFFTATHPSRLRIRGPPLRRFAINTGVRGEGPDLSRGPIVSGKEGGKGKGRRGGGYHN